MKIKSQNLQPGMWLKTWNDDRVALFARESDSWDEPGWTVYGTMGEGHLSDADIDDGDVELLDHPANIGPLFEMCRNKYGASCFFDRTRSNARPWRVFPTPGAAPIACEATLCAALLCALEAA